MKHEGSCSRKTQVLQGNIKNAPKIWTLWESAVLFGSLVFDGGLEWKSPGLLLLVSTSESSCFLIWTRYRKRNHWVGQNTCNLIIWVWSLVTRCCGVPSHSSAGVVALVTQGKRHIQTQTTAALFQTGQFLFFFSLKCYLFNLLLISKREKCTKFSILNWLLRISALGNHRSLLPELLKSSCYQVFVLLLTLKQVELCEKLVDFSFSE